MSAFVFRVPFPATSGHMRTELVGNLKIVKVTFTKYTKITEYNIPVSNHFTY
ncbi:unnamed protein product, partial [Staurois parvus]